MNKRLIIFVISVCISLSLALSVQALSNSVPYRSLTLSTTKQSTLSSGGIKISVVSENLVPRTLASSTALDQFVPAVPYRNVNGVNIDANDYRHIKIAITAIVICTLLLMLALLVNLRKKTSSLLKANRRLENANEMIETFFNADTSLVFLKDERLKYIFVNQAFADYFKINRSDAIGRDSYAIVGAQFAKNLSAMDNDVLRLNTMVTGTTVWNDRLLRAIKFPVKMPYGAIGVGAYISDVTEEYQQHRDREQMLKRNRLLLEVLSRNFNSKQEQLDYALNELLDVTGSKYGYIYLYDESNEEFTPISWTKSVSEQCGVADWPRVNHGPNSSVLGETVRRRTPMVINDFSKAYPAADNFPKGHVPIERFMSIPLIIDDQIVAVAGFANKQTYYTEADISEMTMLMSGVWNAVKRRETTENLVYERNKYYQTLISIGDGVMVIDLDKNIAFMNAVACKLTDWTLEEALGTHYKEVFLLSHEQTGYAILDPIALVFETHRIHELGNHAILTSRTGTRYHLEDSAAPILNERGGLSGVVLVFRDVTEKKEQRRKIEYISFHDVLTGLYNRRFFEEELRRIDTERNLPISIVMGDANGLKLTNDVFGHAFGDLLLEKVAQVMKNVCRGDDIIARWGGDEFVILLPQTGAEEAGMIAERIRLGVAEQQIRGIQCSISMGYDTKTQPHEEIMRTLSNAESKMYSIKTLRRREMQSIKLDAIISALHSNSTWDKQHAERVSSLCHALGSALGLPESDLQILVAAGRLHDIGKIVLGPELLKDSYHLGPDECSEINLHPVVGYRILNAFDSTLELADAVLAHHESWNGSGYPKGLKGDNIPLLARIITVVESYDRLAHAPNAPEDMTPYAALKQISDNAGILFDPRIAEAFVAMMKSEHVCAAVALFMDRPPNFVV